MKKAHEIARYFYGLVIEVEKKEKEMLIKQRKIVSVAVVLSLIVAMGAGLEEKPVGASSDYGINNPVIDSSGVTTWDKVKFGSYYQTAEFKTEPIKWRVLSVDGDDAFLLADECLDCKPYDTKRTVITWEKCSLRKWLNEDFYSEAFSSSEQTAIQETAVVNGSNLAYDAGLGKDTMDYIYLLSVDEAGNAEYGFASDAARESNNTGYATCNGACDQGDGKGDWWLRRSSMFDEYASGVHNDGSIHDNYWVTGKDVAVRPALHLDLSSSVYADAGEVDSKANVTNKNDGISAPTTDQDGVTTWDCVYFGNYKQKVVWEREPIEWRVLSVNGDDAFLLADKSLDSKPYNTKGDCVTWETCSLRKWLNRDFYSEVFSSSEQAAIREIAVVNENNQYGTAGGNNTTDCIYLLSVNEVENADYGFESDAARKSNNTDYARYNHTYSNETGNCNWWLRSPGMMRDFASFVRYNGEVSTDDACYVINSYVAVRPALHLDLSSSVWSKSGQVRSDGMEVPKPTPTPLITQTPPSAEPPTQTPEASNPTPSPSVEPSMPTPLITQTPPSAEPPTQTPEASNPTPSPSVEPPMPTPEETPLIPTPTIIPTPEPSNPTPSPSITEPPLPTSSPGKDADTVASLLSNGDGVNNGDNANPVFVWTGYNIRAEQLRIEDVQSVPDDFPKMKWKKNEYATRYEIYRSSKKASGYRKIQSLSSAQTVFSDKNTKRGAKYYYKIRAVYQKDGVDVSGEWSKPMRLKRQYLSVPVIKLKRVKKGNKTAYVKLMVKRSQGKQIQIYFQKGKKKKIVRLRTNKIKRTYRLQYKAKVNHMTFHIRTYVKMGKRIYYSRFAVIRI